jgi:hypothetical protein
MTAALDRSIVGPAVPTTGGKEMRKYVVPLAVAMLALLPAGPATAASVTHIPVHIEEVSTDHFGSSEGPCVDYAGTLTENRVADAVIVVHDRGALTDQFHLTFIVTATFFLDPDDPADGPAYSGTYTERGTGFLNASTEEELTSTFQLVASATGSDGSPLRFLLRGHITVTPGGDLHATTDQLICAQP